MPKENVIYLYVVNWLSNIFYGGKKKLQIAMV